VYIARPSIYAPTPNTSVMLLGLKRIDKFMGNSNITEKALGLNQGGGMVIEGVAQGVCPDNRSACAPGKNIQIEFEDFHSISVYNDDWAMIYYLEHEVGHVIDFVADQENNKSGYYSNEYKNIFTDANPGFVSPYARTNNREDFVDTFAYSVDISQGFYSGMPNNWWLFGPLSQDRSYYLTSAIFGFYP
jgi:hypothetical protein